MPRLAVFGSSHVNQLQTHLKTYPGRFLEGHTHMFIGRDEMRVDHKFEEAFAQLRKFRPDAVFVILGGNDIGGTTSPADLAYALMNVRSRMLELGAKVVLFGSVERRLKTCGVTPHAYDKVRRKVNKKLRKFLKKCYVDLNKKWKFPRQYASDGVHPSTGPKGGCASLLRLVRSCLDWAAVNFC